MRKLPSFITRRLRRAITVPNALATVAVIVAGTGSAYAAFTVSGLNVRNNTIEGRDIKNLSLASNEFSTATMLALRVKGDKGDTGPLGDTGATGKKGTTGDQGTPAPRAFTFQTAAQTARVGGNKPNPNGSEMMPDCPTSAGWGDPMIGCNLDGTGSPTRFPRWNYRCGSPSYHCNTTNLSVPQLSRSNRTVLVTSENANGGLLDLPYKGTLVLTATATFFTQRSGLNQRLECQLQVSPVLNGQQQPAWDIGAPATVYRRSDATDPNQQERLVTIAVTAAAAVAPGVYETQLACRAPDDNGTQADRLEFIEGNMSVLSTRTNGLA